MYGTFSLNPCCLVAVRCYCYSCDSFVHWIWDGFTLTFENMKTTNIHRGTFCAPANAQMIDIWKSLRVHINFHDDMIAMGASSKTLWHKKKKIEPETNLTLCEWCFLWVLHSKRAHMCLCVCILYCIFISGDPLTSIYITYQANENAVSLPSNQQSHI